MWFPFAVDSTMYELVIIPVLIILARILDVSIGTVRIIYVSKGMKRIAPVLGFFEVVIWLVAVGQIMQNLSNVVNYIAYGLGFAIGNYLGLILEERITLGHVLLRVISRRSASELEEYFRRSGYRFAIVHAESDKGPVNVIFMPLKRRDVSSVIRNVKRYNPRAFYTLEDVRSVSEEVSTDPVMRTRTSLVHRLIPRAKKK